MMIPGIIFLSLMSLYSSADTMRLPVNRGRIISLQEKSAQKHRGIFIQPSDDFNVRSCSDGRVQNVFQVGSDWAMVIMQYDTSYTYAQMDSVFLNPGEFVNRGDLIGQRKLIPNDYKSIIFFVLKGNKELDPEKFIIYQK
jgi:septal ring factor EnvC (AmiA/AmiB activator)